MRRLLLAAAAFLALGEDAASQTAAGVDPARLSAITRELASPAFAGRKPGTPGEEKTVAFLVERFRALGLKPAGPGGRWVQDVPLLKMQAQGAPRVKVTAPGGRFFLSHPSEIYLGPGRGADMDIQSAPLVFVGYGAAAPERMWDDFKGVDLTGKVAIFLVNDPDFEAEPGADAAGRFGGKTMTVYGRWAHKFDEAARRGAAAALVIHEDAAAGYGWNVVQSSAGLSYALDDGAAPSLAAQGWLSRPAAERLLAARGLGFDAVKRLAQSAAFKPIDLGTTLSAQAKVAIERISSRNVLAQIPGAAVPTEAVVFAAHWDGTGPSGGAMNPAAVDNALGVAGLLELARVFAEGPTPRRSLVFAAWTAEEQGLLGAEYYVRHPTFPLDRIAANLTIDVLQTAGPARNVVVIGQGQSDLEDALARAAAGQGRTVAGEAYPERGLFFRSDHYAFVKRGVPSLLAMALGGGVDLRNGGRDAGDAWLKDYTERCYHQACDAWSAKWDLRGASEDIDLLQRVGAAVADSAAFPKWKPGSEFSRDKGGR